MFSEKLILAIETEAASLGLVGATAITTTIRGQITDRKRLGKSTDRRNQTYYVAGRVVEQGMATALPGALRIEGLSSLSALAQSAQAFVLGAPATLADTCANSLINGARASLTRNQHAHVVVVLPHSRKAPDAPNCWVDMWVYLTEAEARRQSETMTTGKVF